MNISNKTYDTLKYIAIQVIPALEVLLIGIGEIWSIGVMAKIAATVAALGVFLGAILIKSTKEYNKLEDGVQDTFNSDSFTEMMGVTEDENENNSAEE